MDHIKLEEILKLPKFILQIHAEETLLPDDVVGLAGQPHHHGWLTHFRIIVDLIPSAYEFILKQSPPIRQSVVVEHLIIR